MTTMERPVPETSDPFPLRGGGGSLRQGGHESDLIRHEVMFEDRFTHLGDRQVFVGSGIPAPRLYIAFAVGGAILAALLLRTFWMQVGQGDMWRERADANRFRVDILPARRGILRDRNGAVLAENVPSFAVRMRRSDLPRDPEARTQTVATVARTVGVTSDDVLGTLNATGTEADEWVDVARDVAYERAVSLEVQLPGLSGVALVTTAKRRYPVSAGVPSLSHILGYVGVVSPEEFADRRASGYRRTDDIGKTGIELWEEEVIRGTPGERKIEVDAVGRPRAVVGDRAPEDGRDVTLSIDLSLQKAVETALRSGLKRAGVSRGSALLMDARDGSLLALVSLPSYDNNIFAGKVSSTAYAALLGNDDHPLFPRAWAGQVPSGSVIKPLIASAALAEGIITPNTTVHSTGGITVGPWFFPDWAPGGHGLTNVRKAIAWSVNTFFYYIGGGHDAFIGLGVDRLTKWMRAFGLGAKTGLDLPGEATGHVPSQEWKEKTKGERWYIGDTYNLSIGQGDLLVTPVQMARVTAAIANGGSLVVPHVVMSSSTADVQRLDASPLVFATVRQGMRETVTYGSGRRLNALSFPVAGKTGTAQWRSDKPNHAWFTGYAPANAPEVVVTVLLEEGGEGSSSAVPVAGEILQAWYTSQKK
ncbi:penicillin-binding protein 2 [Candidatus Uhrbacteria bacterium RIFCSPHIGHO2_12_FULL_60_25]|uniref:Penicillin-binding protein 2 n=1 Tax=Candidatus Uhrbacteria bacterium RIFCSPHIGHO2_12_FULL_60_25 TaxID=1802399 RepID=A0A1F7UKU6_9BACT|nr:MAG: penicillin-binding protein 2 [Candidatus Uhrbacteria bacterium RIFCSPHIGHO2_02_FULL_60_44]OGL78865.1 MAG: penicillin-binding protein 2 [Candidatus Uhrbacteria bacterium RIFCSPHIGHO2_12_FULL_60_25]